MILWMSAALAAAPEEAERVRLHDEITRLAQRNTWSGVERLYAELLAMEVPLGCDVHLYAAQAAKADGRVTLEYRRLKRMTEPDPSADPAVVNAWQVAQQELAALTEGFRFTAIHVAPPAAPSLERPTAPFGQVERDAIERAREQLAATRTFRGLLPLGTYVVGGTEVTVEQGADWQVVAIGFEGP